MRKLLNAVLMAASPALLGAASCATVENGPGLAAASGGLALWAAAGSEGTSMYVLPDDGGGSPDADHDDMIVLLTLRAAPAEVFLTPAPPPLPLALSGIGMLALITRRRMRI